MSPIILLAAIALIAALLARRRHSQEHRNPKRLPLPPGPKGYPVVGTITGLPQRLPWKGYRELCARYGGMAYFTALGQGILVVDSWKIANELLDVRAVKYSNRPYAAILEIMELGWAFGMMQHGVEWRRHRRTFHQYFSQVGVSQFHPIMYEERDRLVERLKEDPKSFVDHVNLMFGTTILRVSYGTFEDVEKAKGLIEDSNTFVTMFVEATVPGKFMVNIFPFLRHLPSWFPGAGGFHGFFKAFREQTQKVLHKSFEDAMLNVSTGKKQSSNYPSMIVGLLEDMNNETATRSERDEYLMMAKSLCGQAYLGGAETSVASATSLFAILAHYPGVQKKAQAELDALLGQERLPNLSDRSALPYVHAVTKELCRWFTVTPLGVAHASSQDDEYDGYFIPKGTVVIPNAWSMMHDPEAFENPFEFNPERYLKDGTIDPSVPDADRAAFGFGRRVCPGRYFSNDMIFIMTASILATFDITPPKGVTVDHLASPLEIEVNYELNAKPLPFECCIKPRSPLTKA